MYELVQVSENCYYFESPAKIGLVLTGGDEACLIDSGNDKDAGKKVKKLLDGRGLRLRAIYNTHSHADHIGGNRYLQTNTGCRIYAPGIEQCFTLYPRLEPTFLYGGNPPPELRHKFLMAQESAAEPLTQAVLPAGWECLPLPGHAFDMVGFRTEDGTVYLADCLSSRMALEKYQISYIADVGAYLETLEAVKTMQGRIFVPSHAEPTEDIAPLAQLNIDKVQEIGDRILDICREPSEFGTILAALFEAYGLTMTFEQHALVGSTVRSYLTWLRQRGCLEGEIAGNRLLWRRS